MVLSARRRVARVRKLSEGSQSRQERDHTNWEWGGLASEIWTAGGVRTQDDSLSLPPVTATAPDLRRVCMRPEDQATERRPMLTSAESHEGTSPHARPPRIFVHRVRLDMYNDDPLWQRGPHTRTSQVTKVTHTQTLFEADRPTGVGVVGRSLVWSEAVSRFRGQRSASVIREKNLKLWAATRPRDRRGGASRDGCSMRGPGRSPGRKFFP